MPTNVGLNNQDTSLNNDTYSIVDVVADGKEIAIPTVQGGSIFYFDCASGDDGYGELYITNTTNATPPVHFSFVRDNDVLNM